MFPIKVLHVVSVEKANYYLTNLTEYSDSAEVEHLFVTFAPTDCDFVRDFQAKGWGVFALNTPSRKSYPTAFLRLWKLMRKEKPDIVHTHLFDPSLIGLTAARWQGRKTVLTRHHSDAIHQIPSVLKRRFFLALENYISGKADHIIAPSQMVGAFLIEKEGVTNEKVSIIPYGQTTERFDAVTREKVEAVKAELGIGGSLALVNVSRLFHRKGHQYLFEAFSGLVRDGLNAVLYLVGEGDFRGDLEGMCKKLEIADRVRFLGWRNDALAIMAAADIIVHPSLEDALSSVVIEAVMLEKPIITTDISGVRDSLDNGKYGEIVPPADSKAFRKGVEKIVENIDAAKSRAKEGRKYLLEYMNAKRVSDEHLRIYKNLAGK
jgi:glycosyltransferase involved in cell wall biosynthesis